MSASSIVKFAALAALPFFSVPAAAATTCSIAVGNVAFGGYDVFSPAGLDTSTPVVVTCWRSGGPQNTQVTIAIGPGTHGSSTANRKMKMDGGGDYLGYNLFRDAGRMVLWGELPGLDAYTQTLPVPNNSSAQLNATIYGRIPSGQDVSKGTYSDRIFVTVMP